MLMPKKVKYRKQQRGRMAGKAWRGSDVSFGNYGLTGAIQNAWHQAPHTFFIFGISLLLSVQLLSLGIVATQSKRYFEELFHLGTSVLQRIKGIDPKDHIEFDDDVSGTVTPGPLDGRPHGVFDQSAPR